MEFRLPDLGEGMAEAEIVRWLVPEGGSVAEDDPLVEVETDKALVQIPSPATGRVTRHGAPEGARVPVGDVLAVIETGGDDAPGAGAIVGNLDRAGSLSVEEPSGEPSGEVRPTASPATRRLARELGVDMARVRGSGPGGRITADDVRRAASLAAPGNRAAPPVSSPAARPLPAEFGRRMPLRGLRRRIAEHMAEAHRRVPQVTVVEEADVTDLVHLRQRLNEAAVAGTSRVSYLAFFAAAAVRALLRHPVLNASLDEERGEIIVHAHVHLGIAVDTNEGLLVAVLPNAEALSLRDFDRELPRLAEAARGRALPPERLRGSTFTITSAGSVGGLFATPIVNHPEVAILGVHRIVERPAVHGGKIEARHLMHISLSFDHRALDGAEASRYLADLAAVLGNPYPLLWGPEWSVAP